MNAPAHAVLEAARAQAGMSFDDLWYGYFGLGGTAGPGELRSYLAGEASGPMEYDMVAQAINERFVDLGQDHPVPYGDELAVT